jgi:ferric-dicitrate binding protein FerR (iron transport regulator)
MSDLQLIQHVERISELIIKYHRERLNDWEYRELMDWCDLSEANRRLFERFLDPNYVRDKLKELPDTQSLKEAGWAKVITAISAEDENPYTAVIPMRRIRWSRYVVAASLAGTLVVGGWLYIKYASVAKPNIPSTLASNFKNDVKPGGDKATLTLSDGSTVVLDSTAASGTIAQQGDTKIVRVDNGKLAYNALNEKPGAITYNTLTTPAAGQFQVALPDGSKVWLNNASSLRYPVVFTGKTREVELKGEAYFEIARNAAQPFKVRVGAMLVDVLGTSFNIAAYGDESQVKTTLLTGGVRVSEGDAATLLKPGEQVQVNPEGKFSAPQEVDADGVIAWKNGLFHFERADIHMVMRMLARWYDVEVQYEGPATSRLFGGDIERKLNLSEVLEILQKNQVHFTIEGKKITVRN